MHTILSLPRYSCQFPFLHSHAIHACINGFSSARYSILFASLIEFYSISVVYGISVLVEFPFNRKCIVTISFSDEKKRVFVLFDVCRQSKMDFPWQTFSSLKYTRSYRHKVSISYSSHRTVQYNAHDGLKFEHLCQCQSYCVAMRLCVCVHLCENGYLRKFFSSYCHSMLIYHQPKLPLFSHFFRFGSFNLKWCTDAPLSCTPYWRDTTDSHHLSFRQHRVWKCFWFYLWSCSHDQEASHVRITSFLFVFHRSHEMPNRTIYTWELMHPFALNVFIYMWYGVKPWPQYKSRAISNNVVLVRV